MYCITVSPFIAFFFSSKYPAGLCKDNLHANSELSLFAGEDGKDLSKNHVTAAIFFPTSLTFRNLVSLAKHTNISKCGDCIYAKNFRKA